MKKIHFIVCFIASAIGIGAAIPPRYNRHSTPSLIVYTKLVSGNFVYTTIHINLPLTCLASLKGICTISTTISILDLNTGYKTSFPVEHLNSPGYVRYLTTTPPPTVYQ